MTGHRCGVADRGAVGGDAERSPSRGRCAAPRTGVWGSSAARSRRRRVSIWTSMSSRSSRSAASSRRETSAPGTGRAWRAASTMRSANGLVIRTPRFAAKDRSRVGPEPGDPSRVRQLGQDQPPGLAQQRPTTAPGPAPGSTGRHGWSAAGSCGDAASDRRRRCATQPARVITGSAKAGATVPRPANSRSVIATRSTRSVFTPRWPLALRCIATCPGFNSRSSHSDGSAPPARGR